METAVEAMRRGAFDFLTKPVSLEKLEILIKRRFKVAESRRKRCSARAARQEV